VIEKIDVDSEFFAIVTFADPINMAPSTSLTERTQ
jgi:hypothetical protein